MVEASKFDSFLLKMKDRFEPNDAYLINSPLLSIVELSVM
jgi:hypothetical protein